MEDTMDRNNNNKSNEASATSAVASNDNDNQNETEDVFDDVELQDHDDSNTKEEENVATTTSKTSSSPTTKEEHDEDQSNSTMKPSTSNSRCSRCTWKRFCIGFWLFIVIAFLAVILWFRISYKGFFVPRCAKPRKNVDSLDSLGDCLDEIYTKYDMIGLSVSLSSVENNNKQWTKNVGYADPSNSNRLVDSDTPYLLSSISKTFIGVALMQAAADGYVDLDVDINKYLSFDVVNPKTMSTGSVITLRHLSTHTSGILDNQYYDSTYAPGDPTIPLGDFMSNYFVEGGSFYTTDNNFMDCISGQCEYSYSNVGAALAAYVIEVATGIQYSEYVEMNILQPLGMNNSHYYLDNYTNPESLLAIPYEKVDGEVKEYGLYGYPTYPDGRLFTSANDLSKYMVSIMDDTNTVLLSKSQKDEMLSHQEFVNQNVGFAEKLFYDQVQQGIFWVETFDSKSQGHDGGDYGSFTLMYYEPIEKIGIVVLTNYASTNAAISLVNIVKQVTRQSNNIKNLLNANQ
mmetsp:Transcript_102517/g.142874  ORF Transcript_102517/g.142874 Transcript_102517/m.142874 type:complete len:515 (-) Transcript_102517:287-1831(-)